MLKVKYNGKEYKIKFCHYPESVYKGNWHGRTTTCEILDGFNQISIGWSECGIGDIFSRKVGRKTSLKRVLASKKFNRDFRTTVWKAYFAETNPSGKEK